MYPIRIIGGGMTGLTLGLRLSQRGLRVVVHERDPYLGGLSSESTLAGVPIERFYHCVLQTDTALLSLLAEIGFENEIQWNRTRTGFFHDGHLVEMTTAADFARFPALNVIDRLRLGWTIAYCGCHKDWHRFDNEPVSAFLKRHGGERLFRSMWEPLLIAKLGPEYDRFAASFIWATISRMLSAREHTDRSEKLGFIKGRYGKVFVALRRAIEKAGGEVRTSSSVTSIVQSTEKDARWTVRIGGEQLAARSVVICAPTGIAASWLETSIPKASAALRKVEYLGVVCEALLLKRSLTPYYVLNLTDNRLPFTGVIEPSNLIGKEEFNNHAIVYLPRYCSQDSNNWRLSDDQLHMENLEGLKHVAPWISQDEIVAWAVHKARYVQPVWTVGSESCIPDVVLAPGLGYLSTAQIYPWPVFNDAVVRLVDAHLKEITVAITAGGTSNVDEFARDQSNDR